MMDNYFIGNVDIESKKDLEERYGLEVQIREFGQVRSGKLTVS